MENSNKNNYLTVEDDPFLKDPTIIYSSTFAEAANYELLFANLHPSQYCYLPPGPEVIPEITLVPPTSFTELPTSPNPIIKSSLSPPLVRNDNQQTFPVNCRNSSSQAPPSTPPPPPPPPTPIILESSIRGRFDNSSEMQQQQLAEMRQRKEDQPRRVLRIVSRRKDCGYNCSDCNMVFMSPQALGGHRSSHTRTKRNEREWAESLAMHREAVGSSKLRREGLGGGRREGQSDSEHTDSED